MSQVEALVRRSPRGAGPLNQFGQAMGPKGLRTRRTLLDAVSALLSAAPLRELTVAQIVRTAKTSTSTFYIYFNDVPEAVLALLAEVTQSPPELLDLLAARWTPESARERARAFVASYVAHWQAHASLFRARNLASDEGDERFVALRSQAVAPLVEAMQIRISAQRARGVLPADLNPTASASALLALIERIAALSLLPPYQWASNAELMDVATFFVMLAMGEGRASRPQPGRSVVSAAPAKTPAAADAAAAPKVNLHGQLIGSKGGRTRARIMAGTVELLSAKALRDCSVADIAKRAGVSTSTFYLYFEDVPGVVLSIIAETPQSTPAILEVMQKIAAGGDVEALSRRFVEVYADHWRRNAAIFRVRNLAADEGDSRFLDSRSRSVAPLLSILSGVVRENQACGRLPTEFSAAAAAGAIVAMIERLAGSQRIRGRANGASRDLAHAAAFFFSVLARGAD